MFDKPAKIIYNIVSVKVFLRFRSFAESLLC